MHKVIKKVLVNEEQLDKRIKEVAKEISEDYKDKTPVMLCLLKGSISYFARLCENMDIKIVYDFMKASSYHGTETTGEVKVSSGPTMDLKGRHLIIVEDIIDTGLTLKNILKYLETYEPASIEITTLLDKPARRVVDGINPKYIGFVIPDEFVLGFGLDWNEEYRNLPYIGVLKDEYYK